MILRKPYAFLIKNFRLLHAILTFLMAYILYKTLDILGIFNEYFSSGVALVGSNTSASAYPFIIYLFPIIILIISLILLAVMAFKNKPYSLYIVTIAVYVFSFVMFVMGKSTLLNMEINILDLRYIKMVRDLTTISMILQLYPLVKSGVRAVGFDIKQFDFGKDLAELEIDEEDSEEFEVSITFDKNKIKRNFNARIREAKYTYKENKVLINIVMIIVLIIVGVAIYFGTLVKGKTYNMRTNFVINNFTFNITDTYVTRNSYTNNTLVNLDNGMSLVIVKFKIKNNVAVDKGFLTANVFLEIGNHKFRNSNKYRDSIADISSIYMGEDILGKQEVYKSFVFEVPTNYINDGMNLKFITSINIKGKDLIPTYVTIPLNYTNLDKNTDSVEANLEEEIKLNKTILKDSTFTISSFEIAKRFKVEYNLEVADSKIPSYEYIYAPLLNNVDKDLLKISYSTTFANEANITNFYELINKYGSIKYTVDGVTKTINNLTKADTSIVRLTKTLYIQVPAEIENAESIYLCLNIRNVEYIYQVR